MKPAFVFRAGVFIAGVLLLTSCKKTDHLSDTLNTSTTNSPMSRYGNGGGKPGETESAGNNLSFPVIWSEGTALTLRTPPATGPQLDGAWWYVWGAEPIDPNSTIYSCNPAISDPCYPLGTPGVYRAYLQKDANNIWQAFNAPATARMDVDLVDWGDNLESVNWNMSSKVRTEVVLYENFPSASLSVTTPVTEYAMRHVSGWGADEVHGLQTDLNKTIQMGPGTQATVFSPLARLTIQKLSSEAPTLTWDAITHSWSGDATAPVFNQAVYQASDGPGYYNAEINVKGKVIYGYTWDVRKFNDGPGTYRITFSFDGSGGGKSLNTYFNTGTQIVQPVEEVVAAEEPGGGGTAVIDVNNNLTYIDVQITASGKGGGKPR